MKLLYANALGLIEMHNIFLRDWQLNHVQLVHAKIFLIKINKNLSQIPSSELSEINPPTSSLIKQARCEKRALGAWPGVTQHPVCNSCVTRGHPRVTKAIFKT